MASLSPSRCAIAIFLALCLAFVSRHAFALTARSFTITNVKSVSLEPINHDTAHLEVSIVDGWISSESNFLQDLFSKAKGAAFRVDGKITFSDLSSQGTENLIEIKDPKNAMDRPLGFEGAIYPNLPADIQSVNLTVTISVTDDQRIAAMVTALNQDKQNVPTAFLSAPWIGYMSAIGDVAAALFNIGGENTAMQGKININIPATAKDTYIALVAPEEDGDQVFKDAVDSDFSVDGTKLLYEGHSLAGWSYVLLKIDQVNTQSPLRLVLGSVEPWATLIHSQLESPPYSKAKNSDQLEALADSITGSLTTLQKLLVSVKTFTNYDRWGLLKRYADLAINELSRTCKRENIATCPVDALNDFEDGIEQKSDKSKLAAITRAIGLDLKAGAIGGNGMYYPYWKALAVNKPNVAQDLLEHASDTKFVDAVHVFTRIDAGREYCSQFNPYNACRANTRHSLILPSMQK